MAKTKQPRRLADNEAKAFLKSAKTSVQKAGLVLGTIRGKGVEAALAELTFSKKGIAIEVKKLLESAIANAENNHNLNVDKLIVKTAYADKSVTMKRFRARARGRVGKILKPTTHITVIVAERNDDQSTGKDAA
jgi:large subunit ribosomal protein L22